jgi:hypothetical protein
MAGPARVQSPVISTAVSEDAQPLPCGRERRGLPRGGRRSPRVVALQPSMASLPQGSPQTGFAPGSLTLSGTRVGRGSLTAARSSPSPELEVVPWRSLRE